MDPSIEACLRCPRCRGELTRESDVSALSYACARCAVRYTARDGIVDFTPDAATPITLPTEP